MLLQRVFPLRCRSLRRLRVGNFSGNMQHGGYPPEGFGFFPKTSISLREFLTASLFHLPLHTLYRTTEAARRRNSIKTVETSLRSFMRYLLFTGHLNRDLSIAIPSAPNCP